MPSIRIVGLACLIALAPLAAAAHAPRVEQRPYVGNDDALRLTEFDNVCMGGPHALHVVDEAGGACFTPRGEDTHAQIRIVDRSGLPVGGFYSFTTTTGQYVTGRFCGQTGADVPADAYVLSVVVDGALTSPYDCAPLTAAGVGIGTSGSIHVTWT